MNEYLGDFSAVVFPVGILMLQPRGNHLVAVTPSETAQ